MNGRNTADDDEEELQSEEGISEEEEEDDEDGEEEEPRTQQGKEDRQAPQKKITRNRMGQKKEYLYLKTVKSMDELNKFRLKVEIKIKKLN
jgi:hypothetical protein